MMDFVWGLLIGFVIAAIGAAVFAYIGYRRTVALQTRARQAERLAELGTLTGGLAHEIKNPLSTVQLNLQLLREDLDTELPKESRVLSRMTTIQRETSRLREILDDFLRYAGRMEVNRQNTDLNALIQDLVDFVAPQAAIQSVQLRHQLSSARTVAPIDSKLIKQCVLNLMLNALQVMGTKGGEIIIKVNSDNRNAIIDVIDTGPGVAPENASRIFDAYYSTRKGGMGLGLAMARRIAREHGGDLTVESEVGRGSCFKLLLPLTAPEPIP